MKIAVLSDQHIDCEVDPASWGLARTAFKTALAEKVDHVILAGDTFDCATAMERDRDRVEKYLRKLGLWHRDRLTIVIGNHDIFHTAHRGSLASRAAELAKTVLGDAQEHYNTFCEWVGGLSSSQDVLDEGDAFPLAKDFGDVTLLVADTTSPKTIYSANGFWPKDQGARLANVGRRRGQARLLAIHHPPIPGELLDVRTLLNQDFSVGFPRQDLRRLTKAVADLRLDAIVCGHVHDNGDDPWTWPVGARNTPAFMMGRSGKVHEGAVAMFGILNIKPGAAPVWKEHEL